MNEERQFLGLPTWKWDGISGACALLGVLVIVITAVAGLYQLNARSEAARAEATLRLLDVWEERGFLEDFRSLDRQVQAVLNTVSSEDIAAARDDKTIRARLYARVSNEILARPAAQEQFGAIVYFFQRVDICVKAGLCAEDATNQFFDQPMRDFANVFASEIRKRQLANDGFAVDLVTSD